MKYTSRPYQSRNDLFEIGTFGDICLVQKRVRAKVSNGPCDLPGNPAIVAAVRDKDPVVSHGRRIKRRLTNVGRPAYRDRPCKARSITPDRLRRKVSVMCATAKGGGLILDSRERFLNLRRLCGEFGEQ